MALLNRVAPIALLLVAAAASFAHAADGVRLVEQKIKAGLIYNFLKYTTWPGVPDHAPMVVCLLGGDPFDGHLSPLGGRTVNQHAIEIRSLRAAAEAGACSLIIIHQNESASWPQLRKSLAGKDILAIADFDGFAAAGGMIEFARVDERIGVKINVDAIGATRLQVEQRLLNLATIVRTSAEP
jgi:hypothetical protein